MLVVGGRLSSSGSFKAAAQCGGVARRRCGGVALVVNPWRCVEGSGRVAGLWDELLKGKVRAALMMAAAALTTPAD